MTFLKTIYLVKEVVMKNILLAVLLVAVSISAAEARQVHRGGTRGSQQTGKQRLIQACFREVDSMFMESARLHGIANFKEQSRSLSMGICTCAADKADEQIRLGNLTPSSASSNIFWGFVKQCMGM